MRAMIAMITAATLGGSLWFISSEELAAFVNKLRGDAYALDAIDRDAPQGSVRCYDDALVTYRGTSIRYQRSVRVAPQFIKLLRRFEQVVEELAVRTYGRSPSQLLHLGSFNCRSVRGRAERISEHALGNAIDVSGFSFSRLPRRELEDTRWRKPFEIRVDKHWRPNTQTHRASEAAAIHAAFLQRLVETLAERGVFRGIVSPSHRGHGNHFHFDYAPWSYRIL